MLSFNNQFVFSEIRQQTELRLLLDFRRQQTELIGPAAPAPPEPLELPTRTAEGLPARLPLTSLEDFLGVPAAPPIPRLAKH